MHDMCFLLCIDHRVVLLDGDGWLGHALVGCQSNSGTHRLLVLVGKNLLLFLVFAFVRLSAHTG